MTSVAERWQVARSSHPDPAFVDLLESVEFGGAGLRYRRKGVADALDRLPPSEYLSIRDRDALIAAYALTPTEVNLAGELVPAVYRGLLAVAPSHRRRGLGRRLVQAALAHAEALAAGQPLLSFGVIESRNEASLRLLEEYGGQAVGRLESQLVYRQWPRPSASLARIDANEDSAVSETIATRRAAAGLALRSAAELPLYALRDDMGVRAAARVGITTIDLGPGGPLARFLHRYGYGRFRTLGRRYNRREFRYLTIHDPLVIDDPRAFGEFTEALLAHLGTHMALFTLDPRSTAATQLTDGGLFGRFSRATRQELTIMASGWNLGEGWVDRAKKTGPAIGGPVY